MGPIDIPRYFLCFPLLFPLPPDSSLPMRSLALAPLVLFPLFSCASGLDLANSVQYQQEIRPLAVGATTVRAHIQADLARGKTKEQIAMDAGFAVFQEVMLVLASLPVSAPAK